MEIPATKVCFNDDDQALILSKIAACLQRGQIAQGANVELFESTFAEVIGVKHAVAVSSGGAALEIAARILGVKSRSILAPTNTFFGSVSGVLLAGGNVRLVDIDAKTLSPTLRILSEAYTPDVAGVVLVHIAGIISPEVNEIKLWCRSKGIWLLEDAAHAHGSTYEGMSAGSFGDIAAFSFFATKVITSGEGGMLVTQNDEYAARARRMRDYGKSSQWITQNHELGTNWRMSEFSAAVGTTQLDRLNQFVESRAAVATRYNEMLANITSIEVVQSTSPSSWYKYVILLPVGIDRERVRSAVRLKGVALAGGVYEIPLHQQPVLRDTKSAFTGADDFCARHICLPIYPYMSDEEQRHVVDSLSTALAELRCG